MLGAETYLRFALEVGAIGGDECDRILTQIDRGLRGASGEARDDRAAQSDPTERFFDLISSALASGAAYLADRATGGPPGGIELLCGWRPQQRSQREGLASDSWETCPSAKRIGWTSPREMLLDPQVAYAIARAVADAGGDGFATSRSSLTKLLVEAGKIVRPPNHDGQSRIAGRALVAVGSGEVLRLPVRIMRPKDIWPKQ